MPLQVGIVGLPNAGKTTLFNALTHAGAEVTAYASVTEKANVSFLILNNAAYAALTGFSAEFGMNEVPGCDLSGLEFAKLAEGHGVTARRVDKVEQLDEALQWSFAAKGPTLLDLRIEYAAHQH